MINFKKSMDVFKSMQMKLFFQTANSCYMSMACLEKSCPNKRNKGQNLKGHQT